MMAKQTDQEYDIQGQHVLVGEASRLVVKRPVIV